ncbi:MAG: adenylosuccinate lyase, partial [Ruthenibacterium sp.]
SAVKKGGDRQELHEKLRVHSIAAAKVVKEEGGKNDLIERVCADAAFGLKREELEAILKPEDFTGRAAEQVDDFLAACITPLLRENKDILGEKAELSV